MNNSFTLAQQKKAAERQLGAFLHVVSELYGPAAAEISAQDWLEEFELLPCTPEPTPHEWRLITIAAASRLSQRVAQTLDQPQLVERMASFST